MSRGSLLLHVIKLTCDGDFTSLEELQLPSESLPLDLILRVLVTYIPGGTSPESYTPFLQKLKSSEPSSVPATSPSIGPDSKKREKHEKLQDIRLLPLGLPNHIITKETDPLTLFLLQQAHRIEEDTGSLDLVRRLLEPFIEHSVLLRTWMISTLLPLLRRQYDYYPQHALVTTLSHFEDSAAQDALQILMPSFSSQAIENSSEAVRDLRGLIGPWAYGEHGRKRRKLDIGPSTKDGYDAASETRESTAWSYVNDWLVNTSPHDFPATAKTFTAWHGPVDVDYGAWGEDLQPMDDSQDQAGQVNYAQAGLAAVYANANASIEAVQACKAILEKVCTLSQLLMPSDASDETIPQDYLENISQADLFHNALLLPHNPLTRPSSPATGFLNLVLSFATRLLDFGVPQSCKEIVELLLFRTAADQTEVFGKALRNLKAGSIRQDDWMTTRLKLLGLRNWELDGNSQPTHHRGVLSKVSAKELELELLHAMLETGHSTVARQLYCKKDAPLDSAIVEDAALVAAYAAYDAASNGNRNRGSVKKASDIVTTFRNQLASSPRFAQIESLLAATHSMSYYSLKSPHGLPLKPVNIRAQQKPLSLIQAILEQNPQSYTHLDDLLEIGQNLVSAGLGQPNSQIEAGEDDPTTMEQTRTHASRQIRRMAIEAALAEDDFDTAYSYIVNRFSAERESKQDPNTTKPVYDDISWRAAYAAGRYPTSTSGASALRHVEQRMELLSQALLLAPPSALADLLLVWQDCEQELNQLLAEEAAEERQADDMRRQNVPGAFAADPALPVQGRQHVARSALQGEAPMGLFDAAREVGAALSKSTFPLKGKPRASTANQSEDSGMEGGAEEAGRVRKRDVVSNMVTGGLVSGIGWVIGAPPVKE